MTVNGLDHVNIQTRSVGETAVFFADVLELRAGPPPAGLDPARITWMYDGEGRALVHLAEPVGDESIGRDTGALHHVAFDCSGHAAMILRLERLGVAHRRNDPAPGLRQIFVQEPNGVLLELNFRGD